MKFHSNINQDIIAVAGTWDPLLPKHVALFRRLQRYSKKKALNPYTFIFYPNPVNFSRATKYRDYFDLDARIEILKHMGLNNVIVIDFEEPDLRQTSTAFLNALSEKTGLTLKELWLGENQQLGVGPQGIMTIRHECIRRNINLRILKNSFLVNLDKEHFYQHFNAGEFELASAIVGHFPTYKIKNDGQINMHDGTYRAKLRVSPFDKKNEIDFTVNIENERLMPIDKPDNYTWLILIEKIIGEL